jgi:hypothetical protein
MLAKELTNHPETNVKDIKGHQPTNLARRQNCCFLNHTIPNQNNRLHSGLLKPRFDIQIIK